MTAIIVPSNDIAKVSSEAIQSLVTKVLEKSGDINSPINFPMSLADSKLKSCAHWRLSDQKLAIVSKINPKTNQQALQRASKSLGGRL